MKTISAAALSLLLAVISASAATPTFSASTNATADTDVLTNGTTAFAFDFYDFQHSSATTVNGLTFSKNKTQGGITLSFTNFASTATNGVVPSTLSTAYTQLLTDNTFETGSASPSSFTLTGLTTGDTYELQVWDGSLFVSGSASVSDSGATGTLKYGPTNGTSGADFIVETFTAGASQSETLTFAPSGANFDVVNAIDLRDLGVVPEPSSLALMMAGVGLVFFVVRRGRLA